MVRAFSFSFRCDYLSLLDYLCLHSPCVDLMIPDFDSSRLFLIMSFLLVELRFSVRNLKPSNRMRYSILLSSSDLSIGFRQIILPDRRCKFNLFDVALLEPGKALGWETGLLRENVLKELSDAFNFASTTIICRSICFLIFDSHIFKIVLEHFNIFWWLSDLDEGPYEDWVIVDLDNIVGPVHVYLYLVVLELLELVLVQMIGEGAFCSTKMAAEHEKLIITSLVKKAPVNRWFFPHGIRCIDCDPLKRLLRLYTILLVLIEHCLQIKEFKFSDVCRSTKLVQISILHNYHPWGAGWVIKLGKSDPLVGQCIIHLASLRALLHVPWPYNNDVLIAPGYDAMSITGISHVCQRHHSPGWFINLVNTF